MKVSSTIQKWSNASFERQAELVQVFETDMLRSVVLPLVYSHLHSDIPFSSNLFNGLFLRMIRTWSALSQCARP